MIKDIFRFTLLSILVWVVGFGIGIVYLSFGEHTSNLSAANIDSVYIQDVINIFVNNMRLILGNILGFFTFGIFPFINLLINGFVLAGFVFIGLQAKISIKTICFATLPHFFEYFAVWFSAGFSFYCVYNFKQYTVSLFRNNNFLFNIVYVFLLCEVFIFIAAFMEVFIATKAF